jgi:uncharacterized protein YndB with AHSA1/START domain
MREEFKMIGLATTVLPTDKPQIITSRLINAPRELVWKVLTSPDHIKHCWGPDGFTHTITKMDVQPGGQWLFMMHGPDGTDYPNRVNYHTVKPPSFMSFEHDGGKDGPGEFRFNGEIELFDEGSKTRIEMRLTLGSIEMRDGIAGYAAAGGRQNLERLAAYLAPMVDPLNKFVIEHTFPVSQARLFEVCTKVEHVQKWMSPSGTKVMKAQQDLKPGGSYHYGMEMPDGNVMWGLATYREITPNSQLIYAQSFSDKDGGITSHPMAPTWPLEMLTVFDFIPEGENQTRLKITWINTRISDDEIKTFASAHAGMTQGWTGSLDQLNIYLVANP